MIFEPVECRCADGFHYMVRSALPEDADVIADFIKVTSTESSYLPWEYVEGMRRPEYVRGYIETFLNDPRRIVFTAWKGEQMIALFELTNFGNEKPVRHRGMMAAGVRSEFWGSGVAKQMSEILFCAAADLGYERLDAVVDCENRRSYEYSHKLGYIDYGISPRHEKMEDGSYHDVYRMIKWLDPEIEKQEKARLSADHNRGLNRCVIRTA